MLSGRLSRTHSGLSSGRQHALVDLFQNVGWTRISSRKSSLERAETSSLARHFIVDFESKFMTICNGVFLGWGSARVRDV